MPDDIHKDKFKIEENKKLKKKLKEKYKKLKSKKS